MSAIAGIYAFNGAVIDLEKLIALGKALSDHYPDGGSEFVCGRVGMSFRAFHTNKESVLEKQPVISPHKHLLAWDGRLDNREQMIFQLRNDLGDSTTDASIVMAAYLKWGTDFLSKLIGDFALSLWDPHSSTLLLARDPIGTRPLYYHLKPDRIVWSSDIKPLLDLADIEPEISDEYIAGYLVHEAEPDLTPYKGVNAVSPGNVTTIRNGQQRIGRFWRLDPTYEITYKSDSEYEEHFRILFRDAVRCRLRSNRPVWSELSGGLDSSSIVCMADDIVKNGNAHVSEIGTVSYVYDESPISDERKFIKCVEEKRGKPSYHLREEDYRILTPSADESFISIPNFLSCFAERHRALCEAMRENSARVLLTGHGGDQLLWSGVAYPPELADLLVQVMPLRLHRRLHDWSSALKQPYLQLLWKAAVLPYLPRKLQILQGLNSKVPPWFDQGFVTRMNLKDRMLGTADIFGFDLPSDRAHSAGFLSAVKFTSAAYYRERGNIEVSHPYLHLPLVEFLQAIPFQQKVRPGETRSLMRRAFRDLLPSKIAERRGKRGPDEALYRAIAREWPRLRLMFSDARVCARGYMNAQALLTALDRARRGFELYAFALTKTLSLELWLRSLERRNGVATKDLRASERITSAQMLLA